MPVERDLVTGGGDLGHDLGMPGRLFPEHEERGRDPEVAKTRQDLDRALGMWTVVEGDGDRAVGLRQPARHSGIAAAGEARPRPATRWRRPPSQSPGLPYAGHAWVR